MTLREEAERHAMLCGDVEPERAQDTTLLLHDAANAVADLYEPVLRRLIAASLQVTPHGSVQPVVRWARTVDETMTLLDGRVAL